MDRERLERIILGDWILQQQRAGAVEIETRRVDDVRAGIKLALDYATSTLFSASSHGYGEQPDR